MNLFTKRIRVRDIENKCIVTKWKVCGTWKDKLGDGGTYTHYSVCNR